MREKPSVGLGDAPSLPNRRRHARLFTSSSHAVVFGCTVEAYPCHEDIQAMCPTQLPSRPPSAPAWPGPVSNCLLAESQSRRVAESQERIAHWGMALFVLRTAWEARQLEETCWNLLAWESRSLTLWQQGCQRCVQLLGMQGVASCEMHLRAQTPKATALRSVRVRMAGSGSWRSSH